MAEEEKKEVSHPETRVVDGKVFIIRDLKEPRVKRVDIGSRNLRKGTKAPHDHV